MKASTHWPPQSPFFPARRYGRLPHLLIKTGRTSDDVAHTIVREASNWHAQLIVMGAHGRRGMSRWLLGSVAGRVAHLAQTPLLLVGTQDT
jgi:nucleotide-binding universal stress UspA family protein